MQERADTAGLAQGTPQPFGSRPPKERGGAAKRARPYVKRAAESHGEAKRGKCGRVLGDPFFLKRHAETNEEKIGACVSDLPQ